MAPLNHGGAGLPRGGPGSVRRGHWPSRGRGRRAVVTEPAHAPGQAPPGEAAEQMREATERLREQAWMFTPMIAMVSSDVALRGGAVTVELDREGHVLLMICEDHEVQDAVPLDRRN